MEFSIQTAREKEILDITPGVAQAVAKSGVKEGVCLVYVPHATAGIIINEFEPKIAADYISAFDRLFPKGNWRHNEMDNNAEAHLKSAATSPGESVPVSGSRMVLGTWQRILLCEFDGPRKRRVIVKVVGE